MSESPRVVAPSRTGSRVRSGLCALLPVLALSVVACSSHDPASAGASAGSGGASAGSAGSAGAGAGGSGVAGAGSGASGSGGSAGNGNSTSGGDAGVGGDGAGSGSAGDGGGAGAPSSRWVYGYWAAWQAQQYPIDKIAWQDLTHAALAFVEPRAPIAPDNANPYATLDASNVIRNLGASGTADFATAAHAGGTHPLLSLGGAGAGAGFAAAAATANRSTFIADILAACAAWGYDGVDLDWEDSIDYANFESLVVELRAAAPSGFLITVPIAAVNMNLGIDVTAAAFWSNRNDLVDQLNVMTYTGSGDFPGWSVWYLDPLLGQGTDHPCDVASSLGMWAGVGIPKSKLGVGIGFYGRAVGPPVTGVLQDYANASVFQDDNVLTYGNIVRYFLGQSGATATWDANAMTTAVSWPSEFRPAWTDQYPGDRGVPTQFLTYEDVPTVQAKADWVKQNGYGGTIIWTINEGLQFPYGDDGYANPLLDATSAAFK